MAGSLGYYRTLDSSELVNDGWKMTYRAYAAINLRWCESSKNQQHLFRVWAIRWTSWLATLDSYHNRQTLFLRDRCELVRYGPTDPMVRAPADYRFSVTCICKMTFVSNVEKLRARSSTPLQTSDVHRFSTTCICKMTFVSNVGKLRAIYQLRCCRAIL